jgi:L-threonine kinase
VPIAVFQPLDIRRGVPEETASLPGTCGELFQGTLDGEACLVSCPITRYGTADVELTGAPAWTLPPGRPKAAAALRAWLARHHRTMVTGRLGLASDLPRGRGYGSSTVYLGATLFALGAAFGTRLRPEEIGEVAATIEPTDSTLFPGLVLFAHRSGAWHESLGPAPPLGVIILDPGGEVDTVRFNQLEHRAVLARLASDHREAFELLRRSLATGDWNGVGAAASLSAEAHQALLASPLGCLAGRGSRENSAHLARAGRTAGRSGGSCSIRPGWRSTTLRPTSPGVCRRESR